LDIVEQPRDNIYNLDEAEKLQIKDINDEYFAAANVKKRMPNADSIKRNLLTRLWQIISRTYQKNSHCENG